MIKKIIYSLIVICFIALLVGCTNRNSLKIKNNYNNDKEKSSVKIIINNNEYLIDLEDNETVKKFISKLPLEFSMNELNGNEKYIYLEDSLPTNPVKPKHINAGDVMLFGNNCLVIFYKSFSPDYSYTKIGYIDKLPDLGSENIEVKIMK